MAHLFAVLRGGPGVICVVGRATFFPAALFRGIVLHELLERSVAPELPETAVRIPWEDITIVVHMPAYA